MLMVTPRVSRVSSVPEMKQFENHRCPASLKFTGPRTHLRTPFGSGRGHQRLSAAVFHQGALDSVTVGGRRETMSKGAVIWSLESGNLRLTRGSITRGL